MRRRTLLLGLTALAALGGAGLTWRSFATDLASARARIRGHSSTIEGRFGTLEYAQEGQGAPVLMIQGVSDAYGTLAQLDAIAAGVSGTCDRLVLEDCGHGPHRERPDDVLAREAAFLRHVLDPK